MKKDRFSLILEMLDEKGSVQVAQLAKKLQVSEVTIRSDLNIMSSRGLLERIHGGARKLGDNLYKGKVQETVYRNTGNKMAIAKAAYDRLTDGDTILIDDSSTCLYLVRQFRKHPEKKINIFTNSIFAAAELLEARHVSLYVLGGEISGNLGSTFGKAGRMELQEIHADYCFLGANGISAGRGASIMGYPQMKTKQAMMRAADQKILLVDSHKFGLEFSSVIATASQFDAILTDGFYPSKALNAVCEIGNVQIAEKRI